MRIRDLARRVLNATPGSPDFANASRTLAGLALCRDPAVSAAATEAVFGKIVEPWSDRFDPSHCDAYIAFMSEALYAPGSPIAGVLADLGYPGPRDLAARYHRIRRGGAAVPLRKERVRTVVVLSRITLGADIAVTSTVIRAALEAFPAARVHLLAPEKSIDLLASDDRVLGRSMSYGRSALLSDRLQVWTEVRERVDESIVGLNTGEWVLVDPDSRLTQLGLLPLGDDRFYHFFESRSAWPESAAPVGCLAARWCASNWQVGGDEIMPFARVRSSGDGLPGQLRAERNRRIAAVSFGVGGRSAKRLGTGFEDGLLELLRACGYLTVLDCGAGHEEARDADARLQAFSGSKVHRDEGDAAQAGLAELLSWKGSLAGFGQLIRASSVYIGYDSAAAHLAAAHGVPVISVFAGAPTQRFRDRWTPFGPGTVRVIPAEAPRDRPSILRQIESVLHELEAEPDDT